MANIDLNISPYFDDFDENKDFLRVLFRPGFPVQARELTTASSILQEQIKRTGDFLLKDGARVTGAKIQFDKKAKRFTLTGSSNTSFPSSAARASSILSNIQDLENLVITNEEGTVKAVVMSSPTGTNKITSVGNLYLKYISSTEFDSAGGYIYATLADNPSQTAELYNTFSDTSECSLAHIEEGVYYVQGFFTRVKQQTVVVDNSSKSPNVKLGFTVSETLVTPNTDTSLFDNARGSSNEGAPGAHRLQQSLAFGIRSLSADTDPNFFEVMNIQNGISIQQTSTTDNIGGGIAKAFSDRIYETLGSYQVSPTILNYNYTDSDTTYAYTFDRIKAYVNGDRFQSNGKTSIIAPKPESTLKVNSESIDITGVPYINVNIETNSALPGFVSSTSNNPHLHVNRLLLQDSDSKTYGYARAYGLSNISNNDTRLYIYDVKFFQKLTLQGTPHVLGIGYDIKTINDTAAYYTQLENTGGSDTSWIADSDILLIDYNKNFRVGQTISSSVDKSLKKQIVAAQSYNWNNITNIRGKSGTFYAKIKSNSKIQNNNSQLLGLVPGIVRTARDDSKVFDNDFEVLMPNPPLIAGTGGNISITPKTTDSFFSTATSNGDYVRTRIDDGNEIDKKLKYAYLKIRNGSDRTTSINYGWTTNDREMTLIYSDIHKVQGLSQGTINNSFSHFNQININIAGGGIIPQGSMIIGSTSRTQAIVALSNTSLNEIELSNTNGYHTSRIGTGSTTVIEIIKRDNTKSFINNEQLIIVVPNDKDNFTNIVTFESNRSIVATNITETFGNRVEQNYFVDDGQKKYIYETGKLIRKRLIQSPSKGDITIFFSYYEDQDATNKFYYNADSYLNGGFGKSNPVYNNRIVQIKGNDVINGISRKNIIDFRKKLQSNTNTGLNAFHFNHKIFENRSSLLPGLGNSFDSKSRFTFTFEEYLSRYDILYINSGANKQISRLAGLPARNPQVPKFSNSMGMKLATVKVPGAFKVFSQLSRVIENNRNFTMKDIQGIENRLKNLENLVSLSILETQALAEDVSDRTKLGFIVDDFSTSTDNVIQDYNLSTATASLKDKTLRPVSVSTTVDVEVLDSTDLGLRRSGIDPFYFKQGFITKTYTQSPNIDNNDNEYVSQLQASSSLRINPYATSTYTGYITLDPARDTVKIKSSRQVNKYTLDREGIVNDSDVTLQEFETHVKAVPMSDRWAGDWEDLGSVSTLTAVKGNFSVSIDTQPQIKNTFQKQLVTRDKSEQFDRENTFIDTNAYIPSREVIFNAEGLKPNTVMTAMFDHRDVTTMCIQADDTSGALTFSNSTKGVLKTDGFGLLKGKFTIPANTYKTGNHIFTLKDETNISTAQAKYSAGSSYDIGNLSKFRTEGIEDVMVLTESRLKTFNKVSRYLGRTIATDTSENTFEGDKTNRGVTQTSNIMDDIHAANNIADPFEPASNGTLDYSDFSSFNGYNGDSGIEGHVQSLQTDHVNSMYSNDGDNSDHGPTSNPSSTDMGYSDFGGGGNDASGGGNASDMGDAT
tara:strand:+ start:19894 stop:24447 length:4554 start_codon:yes stop_codon:yes gene_type:complete